MGYEQRCYTAKITFFTLHEIVCRALHIYIHENTFHYTILLCSVTLHYIATFCYNHLMHDSPPLNTRLRHIAAHNLHTWHPNCYIRSILIQDLRISKRTCVHNIYIYVHVINHIIQITTNTCIYIYMYIHTVYDMLAYNHQITNYLQYMCLCLWKHICFQVKHLPGHCSIYQSFCILHSSL